MNKQIIKLCLSALWSISAIHSVGAQVELNPSIPTLHPNCGLVLESAGMEVLMNSDCTSVFLAPAAFGRTNHAVNLSQSVNECRGLKSAVSKKIDLIEAGNELSKLTIEAIKNGNLDDVKSYSDAQTILSKQIEDTNKVINDTARLPGATIRVSYDNEIRDEDIERFLLENKAVFQNTGFIPQIRKAEIKDSIYSFNYISNPLESAAPIILGTTIPGLEVLNATNGVQKDVAHVKAKDVVSGQIRVSLNGICRELDEHENFKSKQLQNLMVVNRSYSIPALSMYGYTASFEAHSLTKALGEKLQTGSFNGIRRSDIYDMAFNTRHNGSFKMQYTEGHQPDSEMKQAMLEYDIYGRLFDRYIKSLEDSELLKFQQYEDPNVSDGGYVDFQETGRKCHRKWYGSKKCWDVVYNVKKWVDWQTSVSIDEVNESDFFFQEKTRVNETVNTQRSSSFK